MRLSFTWVDVFAAEPLLGNQLVVFRAPPDLPSRTMERLTRELNHSETTFLCASASGVDARVRIFIATAGGAEEIPFAGHPLLGSACVAALGASDSRELRLETGAGVIPVTVSPMGEREWVARMVQPLPRVVRVFAQREAIAAALGLAPGELRADLAIEAVDNGMQTVLVPLVAVEAVRHARPRLAELRELFGRDGLCVLVFATGGVEPGADVHCRVFSPFDLVAEDPATGSANGPLGEYLVRHGLARSTSIQSEQGFECGRPSRLEITVRREGGATRAVEVGGRVQVLGEGEFVLPDAR